MTRNLIATLTLASALIVGGVVARADESVDKAALAKALPAATVSLQQGLATAESEGTPISGKFELDEGKLELSAYTAKAGKFSEVVVDHTTGKITTKEAITSGEDFTEAQAQAKAMVNVKGTLQAAVDRAEHGWQGSRAVSVVPKLIAGHAVAVVTLMKGNQSKDASIPLE